MKLTFAASEGRFGPEEQKEFEVELRPIEALVANESRSHLHVVLSRERRDEHRVSLSLDLPKRFLFATESDRSRGSAIRLACESLIRKLSRYRERVERGRARRTRRPTADEPLADAAARGDLEGFRQNIAKHLERLRTYIKWELHHDVRTTRRVRSRISVEDVADNVLTDLFDRFQKGPPALPAEQWMIRRALERLDARIRESLREPREQQAAGVVEADVVPEEYQDEYERLHDTFPELYGMGEPTPLDRLAAGDRASPDQQIEAEELRGALGDAIAALPRDWRRTFSLHHLEGFPPDEIAELLGTSEDQVLQDLESAVGFLRARLR